MRCALCGERRLGPLQMVMGRPVCWACHDATFRRGGWLVKLGARLRLVLFHRSVNLDARDD